MSNHWTGAQYSLYRVALAAAWAATFFGVQRFFLADALRLAGVHSSAANVALGAVAGAFGILLAVGCRDREAALALAALTAFLAAQDPWVHTGASPHVALQLLFHFYTAPAPYGSVVAAGRADPGGGWRLSPALYRGAWWLWGGTWALAGLSALARTDGGYHLLITGTPDHVRLGLGAAMLVWCAPALAERGRPIAWGASTVLILALFAADAAFFGGLPVRYTGLVTLHVLCFDPGWIAPRRSPSPDRLFFDGGCGLCHRGVRFVLSEDASGCGFRFAPLGGRTFAALASERERAALPDSFVVLTGEGRVLVKSRAVLRVLARLGGMWRVLSALLWLIPRPLRDLVYDVVAAFRKRVFRSPDACCPTGSPTLRARFDP